MVTVINKLGNTTFLSYSFIVLSCDCTRNLPNVQSFRETIVLKEVTSYKIGSPLLLGSVITSDDEDANS